MYNTYKLKLGLGGIRGTNIIFYIINYINMITSKSKKINFISNFKI
jgi:hypothetical protein